MTVPVVPVARVASIREVEDQRSWPLAGLDGSPARSAATHARFAATAEYFVVLFESASEPPLTIERGESEEVFRDECVELFLAGAEDSFAYDELVVNPRGCLYTARIGNPDESRETWRISGGAPRSGILIDVEGDPAPAGPRGWTTWSCRLALPWTSISSGRPPAPGEIRRGNAYRIARGRSTEFLALSPTLRAHPPDFHVPSRFARFVFGAASD
ncbi:MAG: carbohydrate-binding family 9-like protein [Acidobacteriota bacterium]|nr:carbohydrate-binding family 9-like protein [Acidobacteriota bacterium]